MITRQDLIRRLGRRNLAAWSVVERVEDLAIADELRSLQRRDHRTHLTLIIHHDVPRGRGSARLDIDPYDGSPDDLIDQALALALAAVGPAWSSAPPSAPAKVNLVDENLVKRELDAIAAGTLARLRRPPDLLVTATTQALREKVTVVASNGFHASWLATLLRADVVLSTASPSSRSSTPPAPTRSSTPSATPAPQPASVAPSAAPTPRPASVAPSAAPTPRPASVAPSAAPTPRPASVAPSTAPTSSTRAPRSPATTPPASPTSPSTPVTSAAGHTLTVSRQARRTEDFDLDAALADAAADLLHLTTAGPPTPGRCALWLGPETLVHDDTSNPYGIWAIFAHQADSAVERQGLTRYRLRSEIAAGAAQLPDPLSILSNGALDFATLSCPVSDDAVATRRFPIVERGIAVGLGLTPREAALRRTDPNGGVRNLVVAPGTWSGALPSSTRTIELRRLHALTIDLSTGDASLDIALGFEHHPSRPSPTPFTGGTIHLDLVTSLARAQRSPQLLHRGAYHGPATLLIDDAYLIA